MTSEGAQSLCLVCYQTMAVCSLSSNCFYYSFPMPPISTQTKRYPRNTHKMWYPCGSFKGDEKSAALCQNYVDDGFLAGISKKQLDSGVGGSLARDQARLEETIIRGYPQLRKEKGKLEYGYKLGFKGLSKEQEKVQVVELKEQKGWLDNINPFN